VEQLLLHQRSSAKVNSEHEQRADNAYRVRAAPECAPDCPVAPICQSSNYRNRQNPNGWVTWLAHRTVSGGAPDCPVRPSTDNLPNGHFGGWGYKYPQPPYFNASKFSAIAFNTRALDFTPRHKTKDQILSKSQTHSKDLVACERETFVFI
jgi:hypothetical protein